MRKRGRAIIAWGTSLSLSLSLTASLHEGANWYLQWIFSTTCKWGWKAIQTDSQRKGREEKKQSGQLSESFVVGRYKKSVYIRTKEIRISAVWEACIIRYASSSCHGCLLRLCSQVRHLLFLQFSVGLCLHAAVFFYVAFLFLSTHRCPLFSHSPFLSCFLTHLCQ